MHLIHNVTFEDLFINILRDYYDTFGGDPLNVDYKITDNIVDEYAKLMLYRSSSLSSKRISRVSLKSNVPQRTLMFRR